MWLKGCRAGAAVGRNGQQLTRLRMSTPKQDLLPGQGDAAALLNNETGVPKAVRVLFSCSPDVRYALVHAVFAPDALYSSSFVRLLPYYHAPCA